jgi:hypothetical protein
LCRSWTVLAAASGPPEFRRRPDRARHWFYHPHRLDRHHIHPDASPTGMAQVFGMGPSGQPAAAGVAEPETHAGLSAPPAWMRSDWAEDCPSDRLGSVLPFHGVSRAGEEHSGNHAASRILGAETQDRVACAKLRRDFKVPNRLCHEGGWLSWH